MPKPMFESQQTFEAYAAIDFSMWRLEQIQKKVNKPISPIDRMIDRATGYDKARDSENYGEIVELLETIIKNKKFIEADYSDTEKLLEAARRVISVNAEVKR